MFIIHSFRVILTKLHMEFHQPMNIALYMGWFLFITVFYYHPFEDINFGEDWVDVSF